jgi:hypothetical protein
MLVAPRSSIRLSFSSIGWIALVPLFAAVFIFVPIAAGQSAPAAQAPANASGQAPCPPGPDMDIPITSTIQAKVTGMLDSGRLKPGKEIWVTVLNGLVYPDCTLNAGAALYAHVTAAVSQKNADSSELSLVFDRADCQGHGKKPMPLWVIGLVGPQGAGPRAHDAVPVGLRGSSRNITDAVKATSYIDDTLNPGGAPDTVHPGIVVGMPKMKLDLQGGPGCSTRITSTEHSVQLGPGSEFILVVQSKPQ